MQQCDPSCHGDNGDSNTGCEHDTLANRHLTCPAPGFLRHALQKALRVGQRGKLRWRNEAAIPTTAGCNGLVPEKAVPCLDLHQTMTCIFCILR
mmetsp:Transcript_11532/g.16230  ORF Transcript_11532/g.16230 Transcript_11532/m.16230 type:complete len:94 (+) Transcript_11532:129-410(+)